MCFVPEDYIHNKAFDMEQCDQDAILYTMNVIQSCADSEFADAAKAKSAGKDVEYKSKMERFNNYLSNLSGMKKTLESIGIYVEYDWPGHRGKWFFPTYNDALGYKDWIFQCAD